MHGVKVKTVHYLFRHILGSNSGQKISRALSSGSDTRNFRAATEAESRTYGEEFHNTGHNTDNAAFYLNNIKSTYNPLKPVKYICFPTFCRTEFTLFCCIQPCHCVKQEAYINSPVATFHFQYIPSYLLYTMQYEPFKLIH